MIFPRISDILTTVDDDWIDVPGGQFLAGLTADDVATLARINVEVSERHLEDDPDRFRWGTDRMVFRERSGNPDFLVALLTALCPARSVTLKPFRIARRPVLCGQFSEFCRTSGKAWRPPLHSKPEHVATGVPYRDAVRYAEWADARLPTAEEWERAARGSSRRLFPWGPGWKPAADAIMTATFGSWAPGSKAGLDSPEGCLDLLSGFGQWCQGAYAPDPAAWSLLRKRPKGELGADWPVAMGRQTGPIIPNAVVPDGSPPDDGGFLPGFRLATDRG